MASPTWHSGITQDTWGVLPNSDLNASGLLEDADAHWTVDAWGGGVIVTGGLYIGSTLTAGTFLVIWGGGHTNSGNNAIYAYGPFENNSPTWNRLRNTTSTPPQNVSVDGSGNPVSRHTYSFLSYVNDGTRNWMVSIGRTGQYNNAYGDGDINVFDFAQVSPNSNLPWSIKTAGTNSHGDPAVGDCVVYEPSSGKIWFHCIDQHITGSYVVSSATFAFSGIYQNDLAGYGGNAQAALDTSRGIIAMWDNRNGISFYRTNDITTADYYVPSTTGTAPTTGNGSIVYDSANDCFRVWIGGGKQLWKLKAPATSPYQGGNSWTWSNATPGSGSTPDAQNTNGTFGRFNMINSADIVGMPLMNAYNGTMYFYKSGPSVAASGTIRRNALLNGLGASGKFFNNPLG